MPIAAECPFYRYEKEGVSHCECGDWHFPDAQVRRDVLYGLCAHPTNYRNCPFYAALERFYERKYK